MASLLAPSLLAWKATLHARRTVVLCFCIGVYVRSQGAGVELRPETLLEDPHESHRERHPLVPDGRVWAAWAVPRCPSFITTAHKPA